MIPNIKVSTKKNAFCSIMNVKALFCLCAFDHWHDNYGCTATSFAHVIRDCSQRIVLVMLRLVTGVTNDVEMFIFNCSPHPTSVKPQRYLESDRKAMKMSLWR